MPVCAFGFVFFVCRSSWSAGQSVYSPFRNYSSRSGYMPYYQRKQEQNAKKEHDNEENKRDKLTSATTAATTVTTTINPSSSYFSNTTSAPSSFALSNTTTATTTVSSPTSTSFRRCLGQIRKQLIICYWKMTQEQSISVKLQMLKVVSFVLIF